MTRDPRTVNASDTIIDAARVMSESDIGDVIVDGRRGDHGASSPTATSSSGRSPRASDPESASVGDVCTPSVETIEPDASVDEALRRCATSRHPQAARWSKNGRPVGIVSLGDLAVEREPDSTLADISAASPDN